MSESDRRFIRLALSLGAKGLGIVWPRPSVGCVLVRAGRIVGRGCTTTSRHGERVALDQAGEAARGATAYVTLEPCSHTGRTPPCADALIAAGVERVVSALEDPDPRVQGRGHARLRAAGIVVDVGLCAEEARIAHQGFLTRQVQGRPFVTLKLANSFDGRIATASGESQWITGPAARRHVHGLRASHDAVLIGAGTARADNPSLTVRGLGLTHQPVRVVWSRNLDLQRDTVLATTARDVPVWICCAPDAPTSLRTEWEASGARLIEVPVGAGRQLDPAQALAAMAEAGITRVFCEGGGALAAALLASNLVDQLIGYTAGLALGAEGWPALGAMGLDRLEDAPRFALAETTAIGGDVMHRWVRAKSSATRDVDHRQSQA